MIDKIQLLRRGLIAASRDGTKKRSRVVVSLGLEVIIASFFLDAIIPNDGDEVLFQVFDIWNCGSVRKLTSGTVK